MHCCAAKVPDGIDLETASGLRIAGLTAVQCLRDVAKVEAGDVVLIHSAAGAVGTLAVQIAHAAGATVIATASTEEKHEYLKEIGAHYVFQSRTLDFVEDVMKVWNSDKLCLKKSARFRFEGTLYTIVDD